MGYRRLAAGGAGLLLVVSILAGCGNDEPLAGCGPWVIDDELAVSRLADFEFLNEQRSASRQELERVVVAVVEATFGIDDIATLTGDAEQIDAALLPAITKEILTDERPFPPEPDWLVLGSSETRWAVVLYDDALGNAPLDARLGEGWYLLGDVYRSTCG